jgi:UDPglucose 6-dehydrogenase
MAAAIASRGFEVVGVDVNPRSVRRMNAGQAPVQETDLEQTIAANRTRLRATTSHREAILSTDVTFVIVPTPSDEQGAFSLQYAAWAFRQIGMVLRDKPSYHLVVLTSTVLPGATRYGLLPILEHESGKKAGPDFGLCYGPEFIALGSVIHDFLNPDFTLIGENDEHSGSVLQSCYEEIMINQPICCRMTLENAELAKLAVNSYVTMKISFANMLADLCERLPGGDVDAVTAALGQDQRIGRKYLTGALGYGGPCFPRDNRALGFLARSLGTRADLATTTDGLNRSLTRLVVERLAPIIPRNSTVAVLGLAYKPHSHIVEESQGIQLARALSNMGARVVAYDPLAGEPARLELHDQVVVLDTLDSCLTQADVILVTTPDPEFLRLSAADLLSEKESVIVVDFWRQLDPGVRQTRGINYIPFGRNLDDAASKVRLRDLWSSAVHDPIREEAASAGDNGQKPT